MVKDMLSRLYHRLFHRNESIVGALVSELSKHLEENWLAQCTHYKRKTLVRERRVYDWDGMVYSVKSCPCSFADTYAGRIGGDL